MATSLGLILNKVGDGPPAPPKLAEPVVWKMANGYEIKLGKNPTKMRKGKSGEIPRG